MQNEVTDPIEQERIFSSFLAKQAAHKKRCSQLQSARFGPPWIWICFAALTWGFVAAGWLVDPTTRNGLLIVGAFPLAMLLLGFPLIRGITKFREELLLGIIEEEAPETYHWLKKEKFTTRH